MTNVTIPPTGYKPFKPGEISGDKPTGYKPFTPTIITSKPNIGGGGGANAPILGPGGIRPGNPQIGGKGGATAPILNNVVSGGSTNNIATTAATLTGVATLKNTPTSKQLFSSSVTTAKTMRKL